MDGYPPDIDGLGAGGLKVLVYNLLEKTAVQDAEITALRGEILRLKGLSERPKIKPSGMDKKAQSRATVKAGRSANKTRRGSKKGRVSIDEKRVIKTDAPMGSRFKGYEDYLVQDIQCCPHTVLLRRERWLTPEGRCLVAPLPAGTRGHFGPGLRRFVLAQYHDAQSTVGVPGMGVGLEVKVLYGVNWR